MKKKEWQILQQQGKRLQKKEIFRHGKEHRKEIHPSDSLIQTGTQKITQMRKMIQKH